LVGSRFVSEDLHLLCKPFFIQEEKLKNWVFGFVLSVTAISGHLSAKTTADAPGKASQGTQAAGVLTTPVPTPLEVEASYGIEYFSATGANIVQNQTFGDQQRNFFDLDVTVHPFCGVTPTGFWTTAGNDSYLNMEFFTEGKFVSGTADVNTAPGSLAIAKANVAGFSFNPGLKFELYHPPVDSKGNTTESFLRAEYDFSGSQPIDSNLNIDRSGAFDNYLLAGFGAEASKVSAEINFGYGYSQRIPYLPYRLRQIYRLLVASDALNIVGKPKLFVEWTGPEHDSFSELSINLYYSMTLDEFFGAITGKSKTGS
jgi:hypothetical protein